ncbi:MAG: DUF4124 domain-containing protein [Sandaracinaceae bacterium]|nr:DUF4124 domain-containing protein [Sandaracinaceae bacterium]
MRRTLARIAPTVLGLAAVSALVSAGARADIYTYTDANGVVHYSNVPPGRQSGVRRIRYEQPGARAARGQPPRDSRRTATRATTPTSARPRPSTGCPSRSSAPSSRWRATTTRTWSRARAPAGSCSSVPMTSVRMGVTDPFEPRQNIRAARASCASWRTTSTATSC